MGKYDRLFANILSGKNNKSIKFNELIHFLRTLGFNERIKGSHHIYCRHDIEEILNLQPLGALAKPYQVRQVRNVILKYNLEGADA